MTALVALLGAVAAAGLVLVVAGLRGLEPRPAPSRGPHLERLRLRAVLAAVTALVIGLVTRWPVGALLAGAFGWAAPTLVAGQGSTKATITKLEAIAAWTEMLRDTMAAAAGLEQAIVSTARVAPEAIRLEVIGLAGRLDGREPLGQALRSFADRLDDPSADLVIISLVLATEQRAQHLVELLTALAKSTREEVDMRLRVTTSQARTHTSARIIMAITLALAGGLTLFNRSYLKPFNGLLGQLVLLLIGVVFATAFWWLIGMTKVQAPDRFLTGSALLPGAATVEERR